MSRAGCPPRPSGPARRGPGTAGGVCWSHPQQAVGGWGLRGRSGVSGLGSGGLAGRGKGDGLRDQSLALLFRTPSPGPTSGDPASQSWTHFCPRWFKRRFQLQVRVFGAGGLTSYVVSFVETRLGVSHPPCPAPHAGPKLAPCSAALSIGHAGCSARYPLGNLLEGCQSSPGSRWCWQLEGKCPSVRLRDLGCREVTSEWSPGPRLDQLQPESL